MQTEPSQVKKDGRYTTPKTWGVYEDARGERYFGNHPVHKDEVERVHGPTTLIGLYTTREEAHAQARQR